MLTTTLLDRDRFFAEVPDCTPSRRREPMPPVTEVDARLRDLRALLGQARGRAIRPRGTRAGGR